MAKFCCCVLPSNSIKISGNFCFLFMFCFDIYIDCLMLYFLSELFVVGIFVLIYRLHHAYCCVGRRGHVIIYIERPYGGSPGEILVLSNSAVLNFNWKGKKRKKEWEILKGYYSRSQDTWFLVQLCVWTMPRESPLWIS